MKIESPDLYVIGGGLAGSEAAWQAAERGLRVHLYEMRPKVSTGAHLRGNLGELVCSNSLGSNIPDRAPGLLKNELRRLKSLLMQCAEDSSVPAGGALAVDRDVFSQNVTQAIESHPHIQVIREEVKEILGQAMTIIASGPLTSPALSEAIGNLTGRDHLFFYDAIAPIVHLESIDLQTAFKGSRYGRGEQIEGDYLNCPFTEKEYKAFCNALLDAERITLKEFELGLESGVKAGLHRFFEGCLPVEVLARRGVDALAYGPMRPVGLQDPRTGRRPYAVVQLRQDNLAATLYNLVGFQTNLKFSEQKRIFSMIPGLEKAEFARFGQMHRNTYIYSPAFLRPTLQFKKRQDLLFAGQITGVEGYVGNIGTGLLAGVNAALLHSGDDPLTLPQTTMLGALCNYVTHADEADFQPMKANFGILPPIVDDKGRHVGNKRERAKAYTERALADLESYLIKKGH
jgi:methylenetetrahydrofolate--tRNA-(uracil-5-)-methyltransferase